MTLKPLRQTRLPSNGDFSDPSRRQWGGPRSLSARAGPVNAGGGGADEQLRAT